MKTPGSDYVRSSSFGFTMIEMIGVLAIMAILAAVLVPNGVRMIDRAAIVAEAQTLHNLGEQSKLYLKANGAPPGLHLPVLGWNFDLAGFADLSPTDILTNKRNVDRAYIFEPVAIPIRLLILSSMRTGLALPKPSDLNTVPRFDHVWDTADRAVPGIGASAWAGWAAWRLPAMENGGDFLVVERVNFAAIYNTDLQLHEVTLNNTSAGTVSYKISHPDGTFLGPVDMGPGATTLPSLKVKSRDRLDLYSNGGGGTLNYSYMVSDTVKTFDFTTTWIPR